MFRRWMIQRDLPQVIELDREWMGELAWGEEEFSSFLKQRGVTAAVVEHDDEIVAYVLYLLKPNAIEIDRLVVADRMRRQGVATGIVQWLQGKVEKQTRRHCVTAIVRDDNYPMHELLKHCGIKCVESVHDRHERGDWHYKFAWDGGKSAPTNRLIPYLRAKGL